MPVIVCGTLRFDSTIRNPWVSLELVRLLRSHISVAALKEPLETDEEYLAPALYAAGFNAVCLTPGATPQPSRLARSKRLLSEAHVTPFGFEPDGDPYEPVVVGNASFIALIDRELDGFACLNDAPVNRLVDSSERCVVYVEVVDRLGASARSNLSKLQESGATLVINGGRTPGLPSGALAPGVFFDGTRRRLGRPGYLAILSQLAREIRWITQHPGPAAMAELLDARSGFVAERLSNLLEITRGLSPDAVPFRASTSRLASRIFDR